MGLGSTSPSHVLTADVLYNTEISCAFYSSLRSSGKAKIYTNFTVAYWILLTMPIVAEQEKTRGEYKAL
jgi:hypothetical protein